MKRIWQIVNHGFQQLLKSIYKEDRLERNLNVITWIGLIIMVIGGIMTTMNYLQHKGFVTVTTAIAAGVGLFIAYSGKVLKQRVPAILAALVVCVLLFSYYAVSGVNDGFAILWTMLVPLAFSYFGGVIYGVTLSAYYELLFFALFYTPLRTVMSQYYTDTFMNRFPLLYLCGVLLNSVAMIHYHMSTLKQIENEKKLEQAVADAVQAEKAKGQFLAQMSHEIRTPINAVLGMNEMILREAADEDILEYSENIQEAGKTLLSLINSILDFSKIEDGKMEILPTNYQTVGLIRNLVYSISERAKAKGLEVITDIDENIPSVLLGDDVRLSQVISNLLTNAVKYTEKGYVKLSIHVASKHDDHVILSVSVKDSGIGIRKEDREKLFESFERLDEKRNRNIEGTGLGMAIVTKLLAMMDSEIQLYSNYGEGSTFFFEIRQGIIDGTPIGRFSEKALKTKEAQGHERYLYAKGARILVVDDNEMNLKVIRNLMKRCGIVPTLANSGMKAIEIIRQESFDIVLLDHMMPKMDGIETLEKLKEEGLLREGMTMIALTANAVVGAREMYLQAGFEDYLSKPVESAVLEEKLALYLPQEMVEWKKDEKSCGQVSEDADSKDGDILEFAPQEEEVSEFDVTDDKDKGESISGAQRELALSRMRETGLSVEAGLRYCAGDEMFYVEMLQDYADSAKEKGEGLQRFFDEKNWKEYRVLIHSLKSTSKTIGADEVSMQARKLEEAADGQEEAYLKEGHDAFMSAYRELVQRIKAALAVKGSV